MVNSKHVNGSFTLCTTFEWTGYAPLTNIFWDYPFLSRLYKFLTVNKRLRNLGRILFISKSSSIYTKSVWATSTRSFGKVGEKSPQQLSSRTLFAKPEDKQLLRKLVLKTLQLEFSYPPNSWRHANVKSIHLFIIRYLLIRIPKKHFDFTKSYRVFAKPLVTE